ncbi:MAG: hypothetical protein C5B50_29050 [Verrucomicrobia bacterium]|nr:MAG: hypothetical protein C5B50_29050 [Verrucomicrobiota bacterium]
MYLVGGEEEFEGEVGFEVAEDVVMEVEEDGVVLVVGEFSDVFGDDVRHVKRVYIATVDGKEGSGPIAAFTADVVDVPIEWVRRGFFGLGQAGPAVAKGGVEGGGEPGGERLGQVDVKFAEFGVGCLLHLFLCSFSVWRAPAFTAFRRGEPAFA